MRGLVRIFSVANKRFAEVVDGKRARAVCYNPPVFSEARPRSRGSVLKYTMFGGSGDRTVHGFDSTGRCNVAAANTSLHS
jgi:hypothetical protein